jgi:D-alanyl-lipoteichoic acid acyltransferase DltB (MBOAT superfamily)
MLFPTVSFAIFFTVVLGLSWLLRPYALVWRVFIIGASWFFYAWWDERFVALIAASTIGNYLFGRAVAASRHRAQQAVATPSAALETRPLAVGRVRPASRPQVDWTPWILGLGIALNLGLLGWFKYYEFFAGSLDDRLEGLGIGAPFPLLEITLPVGISFFTFQAISYLVDLSRGEIRPMKALDFATYLSFFPHLVAGPIVRASEFAPQLEQPADPNRIPATWAFSLIAVGLFKKVVISSYLAEEIVDPVFAVPGDHSSQELIVAVYAYAVQIFMDFSGYTDMAIGLALLLGFRFPQNFNSPYRALSLQDFWRRWHMTLSRWLRDYLYIPLGGSRGSQWFTARNLMITFVLGGLWHGAAWTFVVWGAIHGGWLIVERFATGNNPQPAPGSGRVILRWLITFHIVCFAWIFFRAESIDLAFEMIGRIFTAWGSAPLITPLLLAVIAASIAAQFIPPDWQVRVVARLSQFEPLVQAGAFAVVLVVVEALGPEGVAPFIYFQF